MASQSPSTRLTLFGQTVLTQRSPSASPASSQVNHRKPRIISPARSADEGISDEIEIEDITPRTNNNNNNGSPANMTGSSSDNSYEVGDLMYAKAVVTPKKKSSAVQQASDSSIEDLSMDEEALDEVLDRYYDSNIDLEGHDALTDAPHATTATTHVEDLYMDTEGTTDLAFPEYGDRYYTHPQYTKGYARSKGKSDRGSRAKVPRVTRGGKTPRAPYGQGKAPAFVTHTRTERLQQSKTKVLNGFPQRNKETGKRTGPRRTGPPTIKRIPVGTKGTDPVPKPTEKDDIANDDLREFFVPKKPFQRLVREIAKENLVSYKWARSALEALQSAAEQILTEKFDLANLIAIHAKRVTVMQRDMALLQNMCDAHKSRNH